jgi:hypothetical protein
MYGPIYRQSNVVDSTGTRVPIDFNKTTEEFPTPLLPYFWDSVQNKWRKTSDAQFVYDDTDSMSDRPSSVSANDWVKYKRNKIRQLGRYRKSALDFIAAEYPDIKDWDTPNAFPRSLVTRGIADIWDNMKGLWVKDSGAYIPKSFFFIVAPQKTSSRTYWSQGYASKFAETSETSGGGISSSASSQPLPNQGGTYRPGFNTSTQAGLRKLAETNIHDIYTIIQASDNQGVGSSQYKFWRPFVGFSESQTYNSRNKVPSLAYYLYNLPAEITNPQLRAASQKAKAKYNYWGKELLGKSSNLTKSQFEQILKQELDEKKGARYNDLARAIFQPKYQAYQAALAQGNEEEAETILDKPLEPAIQDADTTVAVTDSVDDYIENVEFPNKLPWIIFGVLASGATIYGTYLYIQKRKRK